MLNIWLSNRLLFVIPITLLLVLFSNVKTYLDTSLNQANFEDICSFLMDIDFSLCYQCNDIEFIWLFIKSSILEAMSLFIPKICLKRHLGPMQVV